MVRFLPPTLLALLFATSGTSAWSASAQERDQHAIAAAKLIQADLRIPAERQLAAYHAANYPQDDPYLERVLRFVYLERFLVTAPTLTDAANEAELQRLQRELETAHQAGNLRGASKRIFTSGARSTAHLVNEIAKLVHPDGPPPLVPLAPEKVHRLTRLLEALGKRAEADFAEAVALVQANSATDEDCWRLPDGSPQQAAALAAAIDRRLAAVRPLVTAMMVLRDAAHRGPEFGIDPLPVRKQIVSFFTSARADLKQKTWLDLISTWDFEWGEFNPFLQLACGVLMSDAFLSGCAGVDERDVEGILRKVADFETRSFTDAQVIVAAYRLKLQAWAGLLRHRLHTSRDIARGWTLWLEFQERAKADERLRPGRVPPLAAEVGKIHLLGARIAHAKGDATSATAVASGLLDPKLANPYAPYGKRWITYWSRAHSCEPGGRVMAIAPEQAILIARAFLNLADASGDTDVVRQHRLQAASSLRNGILGSRLEPPGEQAFVEFAPQLYHLYALVLHQLGLRHQAVVASQAGTRALMHRIEWYTTRKKPNPWKKIGADGKVTWDDSRVSPLRVATDGVIFASQLRTRDPNTHPFYDQALDLLQRLDGASPGSPLRKNQISAQVHEGDFAGALREGEQYLRDHPEQFLWVHTLRNTAGPALIRQLTAAGNTTEASAVAARLAHDNAVMSQRIAEESAKPDVDEAHQRDLMRAQAIIRIARIDGLLMNQQHLAVLDQLDAELAELPGDARQAARLMDHLADAVVSWHDARESLLAQDVDALVADAKRLHAIQETMQDGFDRLVDPEIRYTLTNVRKKLALVCYRMSVALGAAQSAEKETVEISAALRGIHRAFADLFEPTVDDQTSMANRLFLARSLWDGDERERAATHYLGFIAAAGRDADIQQFLTDPNAMLARHSPLITSRTELRRGWEEIVGLCTGRVYPQVNLSSSEARPDLALALEKLAAFRHQVSDLRAVIAPDHYQRITAAVQLVATVVVDVVNLQHAKRRLATYYRDRGEPLRALPLVQELHDADPGNPQNQLALITTTLMSHAGPAPSVADLEKARAVAARLRDHHAGSTDKIGYWEAYLLVLEFSVMLGDTRLVNESLSFLRRNRSDLTRDLVAPRVWGDDPRVRRPMNAAAVQLAQRMLTLHEKMGVSEPPTFTVIEVAGHDQRLTLFADITAANLVLKPLTTPEGMAVVAIVAADGSTPSATGAGASGR